SGPDDCLGQVYRRVLRRNDQHSSHRRSSLCDRRGYCGSLICHVGVDLLAMACPRSLLILTSISTGCTLSGYPSSLQRRFCSSVTPHSWFGKSHWVCTLPRISCSA